jgi:hypothetical protein
MNKPLSPAAQAVRRDLSQIMHEMSQRCQVSISATDTLPITLETNDASLQAGINSLCAAALRAAADQAVPDDITWASPKEQTRHYPSAQQKAGEQGMASVVRRRLLLIAAELEALDD